MFRQTIDLPTELRHPWPPQQSHPHAFGHLHESGPSLSPRQMPHTDPNSRRPSHSSLYELRNPMQQSSPLRPHIPSHLSISPRRYGSIGSSNAHSPSSARAPAAPPPPPPPPVPVSHPSHAQHQPPHQHPLAHSASPPSNLSRRHTSADIRLHGWQATGGPPPDGPASLAASTLPSGWAPTSPARLAAIGSESEAIRSQLASYDMGRASMSGPSKSTASAQGIAPHMPSSGGSSLARQITSPSSSFHPHGPSVTSGGSSTGPGIDAPPSLAHVAGTGPDSAWAIPGRFNPAVSSKNLDPNSASAGPTRRSSMASNLHGLLNPTEGDGADDSTENGGSVKRKRLG